MLYLLFIIITLLIAIVYSIQMRIWQSEQYHLENKYIKDKSMSSLIDKRNEKMNGMIFSGFLGVMINSLAIAVVIFGVLLALDYLEFINFLTK